MPLLAALRLVDLETRQTQAAEVTSVLVPAKLSSPGVVGHDSQQVGEGYTWFGRYHDAKSTLHVVDSHAAMLEEVDCPWTERSCPPLLTTW